MMVSIISIIETVPYTQPTAEHQYLSRSSCHPLHTKRAFPSRPCPENTTNMFLQRNVQSWSPQPGDTRFSYYHTHSHKRLTHTYPSSCRIYHPAIAQYHLFFTGTSTFSHPPNILLLCLNIYLSLPSYSTNKPEIRQAGTSHSETELSIKMLWYYTLFKVLYFHTRSSRTSATGGYLDWV